MFLLNSKKKESTSMTVDIIDVIPHADKILLSDIILIYKSKESIRQSYISIVLGNIYSISNTCF